MGSLDYDLPAVVPAGLVAYALARGVPAGELFAAIGLGPDALADPERPVRASVMMPLWRFLVARFPDEAFTLELADGMDFAYLGLAGQLLRHSPTLRVAIERTLRYQRLYDPALFGSMTESEGRAVFAIGHLEEVRRLGVSLEFMAAVSWHYVRQLVGERVAAREVWLEGQPRGPVSAYEAWFGGPVRFGQAHTALALDAALLDRPVVGADPLVVRYLGAYADGLLAERPETERHLPLAERVRRAVERGVVEGNVEVDAIARRLGMSARTMQRHLAASGLRFQTLCDEVRREAAMRLLRQPAASIHEVAFALGYGDVPSFYRAFKRWTGKTPAEVLRELRGP